MADIRQQLLRRLGVARVILDNCKGTSRHSTISLVPKAAGEELIQDAMAARLEAKEIALITDRVFEVPWACDHCVFE